MDFFGQTENKVLANRDINFFFSFPKKSFRFIYNILDKKYWFDEIYLKVFVGGAKKIGNLLWSIGDRMIIDNLFVNGSYKSIDMFSKAIRQIQTGYLYHYAFTMIIGFLILLVWLIIH